MGLVIKAQRWIPVEASFLRPPPKVVEPPTIWNDECVFCHTTQGYRGAGRAADSTMSGATELGIACEACHAFLLKHKVMPATTACLGTVIWVG